MTFVLKYRCFHHIWNCPGKVIWIKFSTYLCIWRNITMLRWSLIQVDQKLKWSHSSERIGHKVSKAGLLKSFNPTCLNQKVFLSQWEYLLTVIMLIDWLHVYSGHDLLCSWTRHQLILCLRNKHHAKQAHSMLSPL